MAAGVTEAAPESDVQFRPVTFPNSRRPAIPFSPYNEETILPLKRKGGYARAHLAVYEALARILGQAGEINPKLREVTATRCVLVARSKEIAKTLLDVWNALQRVNNNRAACLRLTERCATILTALYQETADTKSEVMLKAMLDRLVSSCISIAALFKKYAEAPFIKRYFIRGRIEMEINEQHTEVEEILGSLNEAVLLRVYRLLSRSSSVVEMLIRGCSEPAESMLALPLSLPLTPSHATIFTPSVVTESLDDEDALPSLDNVRTRLHTLISYQDAADKAQDVEDIRVMMNAAIDAKNEVTIIQTVLQIPVEHDSMLQAMRSLQNSLKPVQEDNALTIEPKAVEPTSNPRSPLYGSWSSREAPDDATIHRLFVRTSINSLRRISGMDDSSLASWTIAMFELDLGDQIAISGGLRTYRGAWRNNIVAIKEFRPPLSEHDAAGRARAKSLFTRQVDIWASLQHPNVLSLFGACSVPSYPPWFAVCPYYVNGNLLCYLTKISVEEPISLRLLLMIWEIAKGMEYLHANSVVHGDLKSANILLSDNYRCIVSGFGLNEYLSPENSHLTRWQAPELLRDSRINITTTTDVYAFAMTCVELLTHGKPPWSEVDGEDEVRRHVLDGQRPAQLLVDRPWPSELSQLLSFWWHEDPLLRPAFRKIVEDVKRLYSVEIPSPPLDVDAAAPPTLHQGRPAGGETGKNRAKHASSQSAKTSLGDGTYPAQRFTLRGKVARNLRRVAISHGSRRASMQPTDTNIDASSGSRNLQRPSRAATYPPPRPVHRNLKARLRMRRSTMPSSEQTMLQNPARASGPPRQSLKGFLGFITCGITATSATFSSP